MATPPPSFPPRLLFGSLAIYPQKPHETQRQKNAGAFIVSGVKRDAVMRNPPHKSYIQIAVDKLIDLLPGSQLDGFFDPQAALVPMPGSALSQAHSVSSTRSISKALHNAAIGARVIPCLKRVKTITKSAFTPQGQRPDPTAHFTSMAVELPMHETPPTTILLVHDVVTRGATAMGAAACLRTKFPSASISLFALARTDPMGDDFYDACVGVITIQPNGWYVRRHNVAAPPAEGLLF